MAATMHAKLSKRKLSKINIIQICDEILNPKVPMALRLSSILMGGVVIVYERKVKLLYEDVNRLLLALNEAWKVKSVEDPTILPKGKRQAKPEAVTLPRQEDTDMGEVEQTLEFSRTFAATTFQPPAYFTMVHRLWKGEPDLNVVVIFKSLYSIESKPRVSNCDEAEALLQNLDAVDDLHENLRDVDSTHHHHHQADLADITMDDAFDPYQTETAAYNSFERFDMEGDDGIQFPSQGHTAVNHSPVPSPLPREERSQGFEMNNMQPESRVNEPRDESRDCIQKPQQNPEKKRVPEKKGRKPIGIIIDDEHIVVPNTIYHSWLQDSSDIVSRRRRKIKNARSGSKIRNLLDMPNFLLSAGLLDRINGEYHFPMQLRELWTKNIPPFPNSPAGRDPLNSTRAEPSSFSPPETGQYFSDPHNFLRANHSGFASGSNASMERQRADPAMESNFIPAELLIGTSNAHKTTPNRLGSNSTTLPAQASFGSLHKSFSSNSDGNSISKKRPHSSSHANRSGLGTVEENPMMDADMIPEPNFSIQEDLEEPNFKLARPSKHGVAPDNAYAYMTPLMEETGRTQTQRPAVDEEMESLTSTLKTHLKTYFECPGASETESLNQLADGMARKPAARLFYQTCVLATRGFLKVRQTVAYGDILISRGAKM